MWKILASSSIALALSACSVVPSSDASYASRESGSASYGYSSSAPQPQRSTRQTNRVMERSRPADATMPAVATRSSDRMCLADLGSTGARFTPLSDRYDGDGCTNLGTVQLIALQSDDASMAIANLGAVTCPVSQAFAGWARYGVDRAARKVFGTKLARIETFGSYACRNVAGSARRSAHATADAIDISGFTLADGRRISVENGWGGSPKEREFLRLVQQSACLRFNTVLGPGYNAAHADHFHVEGVIEGDSFCR